MIFIFLFLPIAVIVIYSFNGGRNLYIWTEWSTRWYGAVIDNPRVLSAFRVSVQTALINAVIAVSLGVLAGIALARRKGRWTLPYLALIFVILGIPELVSAIGQMIWLDRLGIFDGITRLSIGHSLFNIAVVALIVRARAEGMGETLEQAAADLGAPPWRAFHRYYTSRHVSGRSGGSSARLHALVRRCDHIAVRSAPGQLDFADLHPLFTESRP